MPLFYKDDNHLDSDESIQVNLKLLELMKVTSYRIIQINGQRRFGGPPPEWTGPPPPKDSEIFIGKIPRNCFEDELVPVFSKIGKIYELRLMMDFSGTNRGYAFVMYTCSEDADKAVAELNNYEIRPGRRLGVVKSTNNCKIYIGTLSGVLEADYIKQMIRYLTEGVVDIKIYTIPLSRAHMRQMNGNRRPQFVIAEYESHRAAAMARRRLLPGRMDVWGREVSVEWANLNSRFSPSFSMGFTKNRGNKQQCDKNGYTRHRVQGFTPSRNGNLINGWTLEEAMDEMLYGTKRPHLGGEKLEQDNYHTNDQVEEMFVESSPEINLKKGELIDMQDIGSEFYTNEENYLPYVLVPDNIIAANYGCSTPGMLLNYQPEYGGSTHVNSLLNHHHYQSTKDIWLRNLPNPNFYHCGEYKLFDFNKENGETLRENFSDLQDGISSVNI